MIKFNGNTFIIAEAGVNHNGSLDMAYKLVDTAVEAGADAVKFQTFRAENLVSKLAPKAEYQKETTDIQESQFEMIKKLELDYESHKKLINYCNKKHVKFLSTPFDRDSLNLLVDEMELDIIKVPSGEVTNTPFLLDIAIKNKKIILSTGMCTLGEIEEALSVLAFGLLNKSSIKPSREEFWNAYASEEGQLALKEKVSLLHCTTEYPTPFQDVNLLAIDVLKEAFGLEVGYSDHTLGSTVPIMAIAMGAKIIEKHFTLDRKLPGPDHKASMEPNELMNLIRSIREGELSLGNRLKITSDSERKNVTIARKSLVAAKDIKKGECFTSENLTTKRPGTGISPGYYWDYIGTAAKKDYVADEVIT